VVVGCAPNSLDSCGRSASEVLELVLVETRPNGFDLGGNNALDQPRCRSSGAPGDVAEAC
jgi:hypothetical protein